MEGWDFFHVTGLNITPPTVKAGRPLLCFWCWVDETGEFDSRLGKRNWADQLKVGKVVLDFARGAIKSAMRRRVKDLTGRDGWNWDLDISVVSDVDERSVERAGSVLSAYRCPGSSSEAGNLITNHPPWRLRSMISHFSSSLSERSVLPWIYLRLLRINDKMDGVCKALGS